MPAVVPFIPLMSAGVGAATNLIGAHEQTSAAQQASQTQAQSAQQALDFAKQVYQQRLADLSPYKQLGTSSLAGLMALTGLPAPTAAAAPSAQPFSFTATPDFPQAQAAYNAGIGQGKTAADEGGIANVPVLMEAPDGSRKLIPQSLYNYYVGKGAKGIFTDPTGDLNLVKGVTKKPNRAPIDPGPFVPVAPQTTPQPGQPGYGS